tara:strand:- start:93 stop:680 length:588 start_codon:yes stop_codon:yes gene_type:complete
MVGAKEESFEGHLSFNKDKFLMSNIFPSENVYEEVMWSLKYDHGAWKEKIGSGRRISIHFDDILIAKETTFADNGIENGFELNVTVYTCQCSPSLDNWVCAYVNLRVEALSRDVRFVACVCGNCVSDEPDPDPRSFVGASLLFGREICAECAVEYLEDMTPTDYDELQVRVTEDNCLDDHEKHLAYSAINDIAPA